MACMLIADVVHLSRARVGCASVNFTAHGQQTYH